LNAVEDDKISPSSVSAHKQNEQKSHKRKHSLSTRFGITNFKSIAEIFLHIIFTFFNNNHFILIGMLPLFNWHIVI